MPPSTTSIRFLFCAILSVVSTASHGFPEYYAPFRNVRMMGMGGTAQVLSDDESGFFNNPAGFNYARNYYGFYPLVGYAAGSTDVGGLTKLIDRSNNITQAGPLSQEIADLNDQPFHGGAGLMGYFLSHGYGLGVVLGDVKSGFMMSGPPEARTMETTALYDAGVYFSLFDEFPSAGIGWGVTTKAEYRIAARTAYAGVTPTSPADFFLARFGSPSYGLGIDFDFGITKEWAFFGTVRKFGFSAAINNVLGLGYLFHSSGDAPPATPRVGSFGIFLQTSALSEDLGGLIFRLGAAEYSFGGSGDPNFGDRGGPEWKHLRFGVELPIGFVSLRGGWYQNDWTAGLGLDFDSARLELASYAEQWDREAGIAASRRVTLQFTLGFPNRKRKPVVFGMSPLNSLTGKAS